MKRITIMLIALFSCALVISATGTAAAMPTVSYDTNSKYSRQLTGEQFLQTVYAEKWLQVSDEADTLEGLCFDREGNLWMVGVQSGKVFKVSADKKIQVVLTLPGKYPSGLKISKDGRIFVTCLAGGIFSFQPDGTDLRVIVPENAGYVCDDMVFDSNGGFYFTNFKGSIGNLIGTVEYVSPDFKTITTVVKGLCGPNGIVMTKSGKNVLFITEICANRLDRFELEPDGITVAPYGGTVLYNYQGGYAGPDSIETDADGNIYQAMWGQGRYVVLDAKNFVPFAQIFIPERDTGHMLFTPHSAIIPGTDHVLLSANDLRGGQGTALYIAKVPAKAWDGYYQFQQ
ncbi:MAG: SMP-30/gluconolactonase/LRE family protein [Negativicutes bacterium]|nr:SMP-30/gluconolactonase/LRE family protein [Negativicutes bacterium]